MISLPELLNLGTKAVIKYSIDAGAWKIFLVSSTKLKSALRLYESMGFMYAPLPDKTDYASADVYMELVFFDPVSFDS